MSKSPGERFNDALNAHFGTNHPSNQWARLGPERQARFELAARTFLSSEAPRLSPSEASAGNLPPDEPNYKALYTSLRNEVLEKVGPFARVLDGFTGSPDWQEIELVWPGTAMLTSIRWQRFRALSTLYEKVKGPAPEVAGS